MDRRVDPYKNNPVILGCAFVVVGDYDSLSNKSCKWPNSK